MSRELSPHNYNTITIPLSQIYLRAVMQLLRKSKTFSKCIKDVRFFKTYSGTWELGTPKGLSKADLNSEVVLFLRYISMYWIGIGTEVAVLNSQVVPTAQVVLKTGFTVCLFAFLKSMLSSSQIS